MKRILSFALVLTLALSFAACGGAAPADEKEDVSVSAAPAPEESAYQSGAPAEISYTIDDSAPEEESADVSPCSEEEFSAEESVPEEVSDEISEETSEETSEEVSEPPAPEECTLRINEVMASSSVYFCPEGGSHDWIELYNCGAAPVDLSRYYITDNPSKYKNDPPLSGVLQPGGYAVVYACGEVKREEGYNCASFSLSKGETVYLVDLYGNIAAYLTVPEKLKKDHSYAYGGIRNAGEVSVSAQSDYCETYMCTPGFANGEAGLEEYLAHRDETLGALVIYELMTVNFEYCAQSGNYYDWVELKNVSGKTIDLSEYYLSDDESEPTLWRLPSKKLEPGKTFTVFCSGDTKKTTSKYTHASFKLSSEGERLFVTHVSGKVSDAAYIADLTYGGSYGRMDGKCGFFYFASPTPGAQNKDGCRSVAPTPVMSVEPGIYPEGSSFTVAIRGDGSVRYTLDGSEPDENSPVYTAPLTIEATTVVRASSFAFGKLKSGVATSEYILCGGHTMPVVCIAIDPDDMYSEERGIYYGEYDDRNANFRQDWERKVHFSLFDTNGETVFADCGIKLTGEGSRKLPKKSFQLKFRSRYGMDELEYDIFGDGSFTTFETLKLRVGEDYPSAIFRDELVTSLASRTSVTVQSYRYCILYINGEYFGIYCFRNKIDEQFISDIEGCDKDDVIIVNYDGNAEVGPKKPFKEMFSFVTGNDMSKAENYARACEMIDAQSLADWMAIQAFTGNTDLGNDRAYRGGDGKWKWLLYDTDWAFSTNKKVYYLFTYNRSTAKLAKALLKNEDFLDLFLTRLAYVTDVVYSPESVSARCDELCAILSPEVAANAARWRFTVKSWNKNVNQIKTYVSTRRDEVISQTKSRFGLTDSQIKKYFG